MRVSIGAAAIFAALCGFAPAYAQNVRDIPAPREVPPGSFKGPQYVDSGGCVFVRAGVDGKVIWVPRVNAQKKVLCGYPPTLVAKAQPAPVVATPVMVAQAEPESAPAPAVKPEKVKTGPVKKGSVRPQSDEYVDVPRAGSAPNTLRCPARAPVATRAPLRGGGSVILCLARDGLLDDQASVATLNATPVRASADTTLTCPREAPVAQQVPVRGGGTQILCTTGDGSVSALAMPKTQPAQPKATRIAIPLPDPLELTEPVVPKGYKLAWSDGRLNANRAQGTAAGQFAQDQIWTRETPARLIPRDKRVAQVVVSTRNAPAVRVSTKGEAATGTYVQIGSFGKPANAGAARAKLAALGLPTVKAKPRNGLEPVLAGPFESADAAKLALSVARRGGFPDAVLR